MFYATRPKRAPAAVSSPSSAGEDAVKKFGNAKSISSDMYFGGADQVGVILDFITWDRFRVDFYQLGPIQILRKTIDTFDVQDTRDANLSRFQGSASISSDMYFNRFSLVLLDEGVPVL